MSWTYSDDPSTSDLDAVRFHIQDTDPDDPLMQDEEIEFLIAKWKPVYDSLLYAAAICAETIAAKFAREVNVSGDGTSVGVEALQDKYEQLAVSLRDQHKEYAGVGGAPKVGGTLFDDYFDSSIKPLSFGKGMNDNPEAGNQDYGGLQRPPSEYFPW